MKKKFSLLSSIFVLSGLFLLNVKPAKANILGDVAKDVLQGIFGFLLNLAQLFTGLAGQIFTAILDFGFKAGKMAMIYNAWVITRDIVNMFFILALVIIAFATILKIETYGMKALLPKLIVIALLINFSYLACGIIIDASQIIADHFIGLIEVATDEAGRPNIGAAIIDTMGVTSALEPSSSGASVAISQTDTEMRTILNTAFSATIIFITGFVLIIGAILLFVRIGALWALIILVPFAWFFSIFPTLKNMTSKWWSNFLKYSFFAPIYVFFIYLVIKIGQSTEELGSYMGKAPESLSSIALTEMLSNGDLLFFYALLAILLFGAPTIAMSMGIYGAQAVTGAAKSVLRGAVRGTLRSAKMTAIAPPGWMKKVPGLKQVASAVSKIAPYTMPEFWKKAGEVRKAERLRKARIGRAIGKIQDLQNLVFSLGTDKTSNAEKAEQFEVEERKKDVAAETKRVGSRLVAKIEKAMKEKDVVTYKAAMELLQEQGDTNDAMIFENTFDDYKYDKKYALDELQGENVNERDENGHGRFSNLGFKHGVIGQMKKMGLSDKQIAPFLGKLQEIGFGAGYYGMYGMVDTDEKGNIIINEDEKQIRVAAAKIKTQPPRNRKLHGTAIGMQGADEEGQYTFAGIDPVAKAILKTYNIGDVDETQLRYVRPDAQRSLYMAAKQGVLDAFGAGAQKFGQKVVDMTDGIKEKTKQETKQETKINKTKENVWEEVKKEAKKEAERKKK